MLVRNSTLSINKVYETALGKSLSEPFIPRTLNGISFKKDCINWALSKEAWVNVKPLLTASPIFPEFTAGGVATVPALWVVDAPAFARTFPVPITDGISRKLNGIFFDVLTTFKRILSLL